MSKDIIGQIEKYARKEMRDEIAHDFKHVDRVRNWALKIAEAEGYENIEQVEIAALLHDIGRASTKSGQNHGVVGAAIARKFLEKHKMFDITEREEIILAIASHSGPGQGREELTAILKDADMMDALGTVGIMRAFSSKASVNEYDPENIKGEGWDQPMDYFQNLFNTGEGPGKYITDQINFQIDFQENLKTATAKKLAKPMIKYMKDFIIRLEDEVNNK